MDKRLNPKKEERALVYKMEVAQKLIEKGHKVFMTIPNPQKPHLIAWVFEKDDTFDIDLKEAAYGK